MIDTTALRSKVIEAGIRGELTQRLPEDGNAEELLEQIQSEKNELVRRGELRRQRALAAITEADIPFTIPETWKWARIGTVFTLQAGKNIKAAAIVEKADAEHSYPCYGGNGLRGYVAESNVCGRHALIGRQGALCGNINMAEGSFYATEHAVVVYQYAETDPDWAGLLLDFLNLNQYATSVAQPGLAVGKIERIPIPLPPLAEQKRIADVLETALALICHIDELQREYSDNYSELRSKVIEAGIRGELTQRLPEDGNAEELLEQIQSEKNELVRRGELRRQRALAAITEADIPFTIPETWKWARFGDLISLTNGLASRGTQGGKPYPVLRLADLTNTGIDVSDVRMIELSDSEYASHIVKKDDLIFIRVNGSRGKVGKAFLFTSDKEVSYCDHLFCGHRFSNHINPEYVMLICLSNMAWKQIDPFIKTTAGQNTISQGNMAKMLVPLPPEAEQNRIVERVNELLQALPDSEN